MDQTCFGSRGFFWPMSNPLFQGRWPLLIGRTGIGDLRHPPSASLYRERMTLYRLSSLALPRMYAHDHRSWRKAVVLMVSLTGAAAQR